MNRWHLMLCALVIWVAFSVGPSQATPPASPIRITSITADSVSLERPITVTVRVLANYELKNVSASILEGKGYRLQSQISTKASLLRRGDTTSFSGVIQALSKGTWKVKVSAEGFRSSDTVAKRALDEFYVHLSDTLNRAFEAGEWIRLNGFRGRLGKGARPDSAAAEPQARPRDRQEHQPGMPPTKHSPSDDTAKPGRSGTFNVVGYLQYHDPRDAQGVYRPAKFVIIDVWDDDNYLPPFSDDDWLGSAMTDGWGYFALYGLDNGDCIGCGTADPYLVASVHSSSWRVVYPGSSDVYAWATETVSNVADYDTVDFGARQIVEGSNEEGAMWCYQYLIAGWQVVANVGPYPDLVECSWPVSGSYSYESNGNLFIRAVDADAIDVVNHEYAHALMYQGYESIPTDCNPQYHLIDVPYCEALAWTEGWADFFPLVVVQDGKFDSEPYGDSFELENNTDPGFQEGPRVEGRVAAALLDLWDSNNDGFDQNSTHPVSFRTIYTRGIQSHRDSTFYEFWAYLCNNELNSQQIRLGLNSIGNNTIYCPCNSCGDANSDGSINIADAVFLILYVFSGGAAPGPCNYPLGMGDANGDGEIDISDAVYLISYIFSGGPAPHCA
jgi:hypothetical protein